MVSFKVGFCVYRREDIVSTVSVHGDKSRWRNSH